MAETARVQYVFLDIVDFTVNRSVEAQSEVVASLNDVVIGALKATKVPGEHTVLLPTGDGMAIALINIPGVDVHLQLALEILRLIAEHNSSDKDKMRRFEVRIGINENVDNILLDINGKRNVAGAGISMAQRIMDKADGGQVLVGQTVYEVLRQRERYMSCFRSFTAIGKHGVAFPVNQFLSKDSPGLNVEVPFAFASKKVEPLKLTMFVAYFMAHAIQNRNFLLSQKGDPIRNVIATVLLGLLAKDSVWASETPSHEEPCPKTWGAGVASFEEQYLYFRKQDYWLLISASGYFEGEYLRQFSDHFEKADFMPCYIFVKKSGIQKLLSEWPQIANEFGIT